MESYKMRKRVSDFCGQRVQFPTSAQYSRFYEGPRDDST